MEVVAKPAIEPGGRLPSFLVGAFIDLLARIPSRWLERLARGVGALAFALGVRRAVTLDNLRHAFPEKTEAERIAIARGAYRNMAQTVLEALVMSTGRWQTDADFGPRFAELREAAERTGVIVVTAHFGNWEALGETLVRAGIRLHAVVRPLKGAVNARIVAARQKIGLRIILPRGAVGQMVAKLRAGDSVAQLVDQVLPAKHGVFVPFFGRPASTTPAVSVVAQRTHAPVYVVLLPREGTKMRVVVEGPFPLPGLPRAEQVAAHTAQLTAAIEANIRQKPDQWLWMHRRWKVQPPSAG